LEEVNKVKIGLLENVDVGIFCVEWSDPSSVDSEEEAELLREVILLNSCSGCGWHPQGLWISGSLEVYEAKGANHNDDKTDEDVRNWPLGGKFTYVVE
jgi:hypothetical protein